MTKEKRKILTQIVGGQHIFCIFAHAEPPFLRETASARRILTVNNY